MNALLPGDLDVSGWELRKSLRLFSKCNLALNEWIGSPVLYREESDFRQQLGALLPAFFNPIGATHHYRSMATQALSSITSEGRISIKKWLYATRAIMASRWIARHRSQPPTEFMTMVDDLAPGSERSQIELLLLQKASAPEKHEILVEAPRRAEIQNELNAFEQAQFAFEKPGRATIEKLDAILRHWARIGGSR